MCPWYNQIADLYASDAAASASKINARVYLSILVAQGLMVLAEICPTYPLEPGSTQKNDRFSRKN